MKVTVTGANGFIGSHVVDRLLAVGHDVTALVREGRSLPAEWGGEVRVVYGHLGDRTTLAHALRGQDCIIHAAGAVGDSARTNRPYRQSVCGTAHVLEAAQKNGVERFVHISTVGVYDTDRGIVSEQSPIARHVPTWNHYIKSKIAAEGLVWSVWQRDRLPMTVLRPSVTLGARDRHTTPRILRFLRSWSARLVEWGSAAVPCVVVDEVAAAAVRVIDRPRTIGRAYNLSGRDSISQRTLLRLHGEVAGLPMPRRSVSYRVAMRVASTLERAYQMTRRWPPPVTRFLVWVANRDCRVDCARARAELDWEGTASYADAIRRAITGRRHSTTINSPEWAGV